MPVFDFSGASASKAEAKCTYTTFHSSHTKPSPEQPIMVLDNKERQWKHHSCGVFTNPVNRTAFDFKEEDGNHTADVVKIDSRFTSLLKWLGDSRINVRLSGTNREDGYAVYRISVLPVSTRQTYIDPAVSQPFQKTGKSGINFHHICCMVTVFFLKIKSSTVYRIGKHTAGMMFPLSLFIVKHHDRLLR